MTDVERSKLVYSVDECADLLGVGTSTVWTLVRKGQLGSFKIGKRRVVAYQDLESFIDGCRDASQGGAVQ